MIGREYEYRLKAGRVMTRAALWGAAAVAFAYWARTNDRGLVLFVIPLTKDRATAFYAIFAGLAALFALGDAVIVARRASLRQRIAFGEDGLIVPKSAWSDEETCIPYASIRDLNEFTEPDTLVVIRHRGGEFTLRLDLLPDERAYGEIVGGLAVLVGAAKAGAIGKTPGEGDPCLE